MKHLMILGAGTGGSMVGNRMRPRLPHDWRMTIVDPAETHLYQPELLFLPFGAHDEPKITHPRSGTLHRDVIWRRASVNAVDARQRVVSLSDGTAEAAGEAGWSSLRRRLVHRCCSSGATRAGR